MAHAEHEGDWDVRVETCRVDLWRGYLTSSFVARRADGDDEGDVVDTSSSFRWRSSRPPTTEEARLSHYELLSRLKDAGWAPTGEGEEWYAAELARPTFVPRADGEEAELHREQVPEQVPAPSEEAAPVPAPTLIVALPAEPATVEPEHAATRRPRRDPWRIAAMVGLLLAIVFLVVLATHG